MIYFETLLYRFPNWGISIVLLVGIFFFYLTGVRIGNYQKRKNPEGKAEGVGPLEGALLGLLALLLSFTFSMSASRYDTRITLITKEANAIETAVMRCDMYPDSVRLEFRNDFKQYLESRIDYYHAKNDEPKVSKAIADARKIADRIWQRATRISRGSTTTIPHSLMLPAINSMTDMVTTRDAARTERVPDPILWLLISLTLLGSMIIGYSKKEKKNDWIALTIYALMTVITIYTIIDLDRPFRGIIKSSTENERIIDLRRLFTE